MPYLLSPDELRTRDMVTALFTQDYEWAPNSDRTKHTPSEYIEFFEGSAYVGGYDGILRFDGEGLQITFISYDESVRGGYTQTEKFSIERILSRDHPKKFLQEMMDRAFLEIMLQRDQNKQKELTNIRGFIIPRGHGRMIYDHLEQPEVLRNENEVLGYWTSSSYHMKDGELLLEFMTNPTLEEQEFSPVHCKPIDDDINTYYRMLGPLSAIPHKVSRKEYEIIQRDFNARDTECKHIGRGMYV